MERFWKSLGEVKLPQSLPVSTGQQTEPTRAVSALGLQGGSSLQEAPPVLLSSRACSVWRLQLSPASPALPGRCSNPEAPFFWLHGCGASHSRFVCPLGFEFLEEKVELQLTWTLLVT